MSDGIQRDAYLSTDGLYRYALHRWWDDRRDRLAFIMLNPSTADATVDDPTIRRCMGFARSFGCGGIRVFNLYAHRATKPADLWKADEPTGGDRNDDLLREVLRQAKHQPVIAAWGANAKPDRVAEFMSWRGSEHVKALGLTKGGAPRHPLYLRGDSQMVAFGGDCGSTSGPYSPQSHTCTCSQRPGHFGQHGCVCGAIWDGAS